MPTGQESNPGTFLAVRQQCLKQRRATLDFIMTIVNSIKSTWQLTIKKSLRALLKQKSILKSSHNIILLKKNIQMTSFIRVEAGEGL